MEQLENECSMLLGIISNTNKDRISLVYKALFCLAKICHDRVIVDLLFSKGIIRKLQHITNQNWSQLVKIIAHMITKLICAPKDLALWLKFDSDNPAVNSSGTNSTIYLLGNPKKLPPGFGIFRNWGAYFSGQDCVRIAGGLRIYELPNTSRISEHDKQPPIETGFDWTISFWTILPIEERKKKRRVLV